MDIRLYQQTAEQQMRRGEFVDPSGLPPLKYPSGPFYHGCSAKVAEKMVRSGTNWSIYLTDSEEIAEFFAVRAARWQGVGVVLRVNILPLLVEDDTFYPKLQRRLKSDPRDHTGRFFFTPIIFNKFYGRLWMTQHPIPPSDIKVLREVPLPDYLHGA